MRKILVLTDSTADLSQELYDKHEIKVIPLIVNLDGVMYQDGVDIKSEDIYAKVAQGASLPKTSAVPPGTFMAIFDEYIKKDYDVIYVGIGANLSGTFMSATIAKAEFPDDRVEIVDSKNLSSGSGLLVLKACQLRDEGKTIQEIAKTLNELVPCVSAQFCVHKMDYLYKGGRCSGLKLFFGRLFSIRPVLKVVNGAIEIYSTPPGKYLRGLDEQLNLLDYDLENMDKNHVMITHSGADQKYLDYLHEELKKRIPEENIHITHAGAVISSHCGYNTIGILWISNREQNLKKPKREKE